MQNSANGRSFSIESSFAAWFSTLALVALFCGFVAGGLHQIKKGRFQAFDTYYAAAEALRIGGDPYQRIHTYPYVYPPFYAFACQPLTLLARPDAARVMLLINAALLLVSILAVSWSMLRRLAPATKGRTFLVVAVVAALVTSFPIYKELRGMQCNGVLLFGLSISLLCLDRRPVLAGCALALGIITKFLPLIVLPYLLLRRRWIAAASTVIATVVLAIIPGCSIGWSTNLKYLARADGGLARVAGVNASSQSSHVHGMTDYLNISITSTLTRLAEDWGTRESVGLLIALAVMALCGVWLAQAYRRRGLPLFAWPPGTAQTTQPFKGLIGLEWATLVVALMAFAPNGELVFAVIPAAILAVLLLFPQSPQDRWISAAALVLMLIALSLPISAMGRAATMLWNLSAASCWMLLVSFALICFQVLARTAAFRPYPLAHSKGEHRTFNIEHRTSKKEKEDTG